ncbi:MAG: protein translocase subunit SecF [Bacteriovoracaceae bacterium]|nr:protein translocase subunit SecF [Bacteriovoracaceae bacterium]
MLPQFRFSKAINFVSMFPVMTGISALLMILSAVLLVTKGLTYGVDFKGGAEVQVKFSKPTEAGFLRNTLEKTGLSISQVQQIGEPIENEFLIKVAASEKDINAVAQKVSQEVTQTLSDYGPEIRKVDVVGPKAGEQLRISGLWAVFWSLIGIMIYVGLRFDIKYSPGAAISLAHDVLLVLGIFCITGKEFNLQILGAVLALVGYSINDTVVIYDRIRENEEAGRETSLSKLINVALTDTLGRTILTSGCTFVVCLFMFLFGGGVIHDFFFTFCFGIIVGTYSSVFVASPLVLFMYKWLDRRGRKV